MPKFTVHMTTTTSFTQEVEADDPEAAIDVAYNEGIQGICAHCSGWRQDWSRDEGENPEVYEVTDADGNTCWTEKDGVIENDNDDSE